MFLVGLGMHVLCVGLGMYCVEARGYMFDKVGDALCVGLGMYFVRVWLGMYCP